MPSTSSTPGHGSCAISRLPSRSTWSHRLAIAAPAAIPRPRLDHAAEHHAEAERARGVRHPHRLADPARLRELDVDPVRDRRARGDVGEGVAVLVDVDRDRRRRLQLRPVRVARGAAAARSTRRRARASCGSASSASSSVQYSLTSTWSGTSVTAADRAHALDVEPVAAAELQLQPLEPPARAARFAPSRAISSGVGEPDRPRGRRPEPLEPEQPPDRLADQLPAEIVKRRVDRRPRGELARPAAAASPPRARTGRRRARSPTASTYASADSADSS